VKLRQTLKQWLLLILQGGNVEESKKQEKYQRQPKSKFIREWRKKSFDSALRGIDVKEVISQAQTAMSELKVSASSIYDQEIIEYTNSIKADSQELEKINKNPEAYLQMTINTLPEADHQNITKLMVELTKVQDDLQNTTVRLFDLQNEYNYD
tara:strand:+ start:661034 stop:661492 length:459 start_codon:yes stop_codon:yes gene_type:complete